MSFQFCRRKFYFLLALALPGYAAVHPVQTQRAGTSQRPGAELPRAKKLNRWRSSGSGMTIATPLRSTFPRRLRPPRPVLKHPAFTLTSPAEIALNRMNFTVSCPQSWQMNVAVRPDVLVPVVMTKSLVARDMPLTANDVELKPYNVSAQRRDVLMVLDDAIGFSSKHALQPGRPITKEELVSPVLVGRDQPVMIVYQSAGGSPPRCPAWR